MALATGGLSPAQGPLDGEFSVRSAAATISAGVVELSVRARYPLTDQVQGALRDGVTLAFDVEVVVARARRFWFDRNLLELSLRRELFYHVISDSYVVRSADGQQESFATLPAAIDRLNELEHWPIMARAQLRGEGPWDISVRASVRRGRMPDTLRAIIFWSDAWHRTTDWYSWTLAN